MKLLPYLLLFLLSIPAIAVAGDEYNFDDLEEFEKKDFEWGGYAELKYDHLNLNRDSLLYRLVDSNDEQLSTDHLSPTLQLFGSYSRSITKFHWLLEATGTLDENDWDDSADLFEAYITIQPSSNFTIDVGKKVFRWGTGYAWNPVGFVQRPKNPNDPDLAREGFIVASSDYVRSFDGLLKTVSFTPLLLPVYSEINEDFGVIDHLNVAARIYILFLDTDIDVMFFAGNSKSDRLGLDFSRNITTNLEIHGELAWFSGYEKQIVDDAGNLITEKSSQVKALLGLRYLTENETTLIAELYHNGTGYSQKQMDAFYSLANSALEAYEQNNENKLVRKAVGVSQQGYVSYAPMQNYFYLKVSNKEPLDILYLTPSITGIVNLEDGSFKLTPELLYTGFDNFEIRLRASLYTGSAFSEYGEKRNDHKFELRLRYYF